MMDMMGGSGWLWLFVPLLLWGGLLALLAWFVILLFPNLRDGATPADNAEEILRARLARSEIGEEEYERSLRKLRREPGVGEPRKEEEGPARAEKDHQIQTATRKG